MWTQTLFIGLSPSFSILGMFLGEVPWYSTLTFFSSTALSLSSPLDNLFSPECCARI